MKGCWSMSIPVLVFLHFFQKHPTSHRKRQQSLKEICNKSFSIFIDQYETVAGNYYNTFNICSFNFSSSSFISTTHFCMAASYALEPVVLISRPISWRTKDNFFPLDSSWSWRIEVKYSQWFFNLTCSSVMSSFSI